MSDFKFIHAADIHLDSPLRGLEQYEGAPVEEIRGATRRAFENLVELAIVEKVAFVLLAGDLYDGDWKDYNTGLFFSNQMGRLKEADIRAFVIAGNHDAASQITRVLRTPENVHHFSTAKPETIILDDLGVALHGQGFPTGSVSDDLTVRYPAAETGHFNIGLLHTSLNGRPAHADYAPCTVDGLKSKGYQYWALGHVHKREIVSEDPWIVFSGNTQGRHIRETGDKGCTLVLVEDSQVKCVEHRTLDVVRWAMCKVDATGLVNTDDVLDKVRESFTELVDSVEMQLIATRVVITGICKANGKLRASSEWLVNELRSLAYATGSEKLWVEKVQLETQSGASQGAALERDDAFGGLLREIRDVELNPERIAQISKEFNALRTKLPPELLAGEDPFDPTDPEVLRAILPDVTELLMHQLLSHGEPE